MIGNVRENWDAVKEIKLQNLEMEMDED